MLRHLFVLLLGALLSSLSAANDPFDKTQRHIVTPKTAVNQETPASPPCRKTQTAIFPQTPFAQVQIIGVLQHNTDWQLMLLADQQVSLAKIGDFIATEQLQIEKIDKQQIHFLRWDSGDQCASATPFSVKF